MNGIREVWKQRIGLILHPTSPAWVRKAELDEHRLKFESSSVEIANTDLRFDGGIGSVCVIQGPAYVFGEAEVTQNRLKVMCGTNSYPKSGGWSCARTPKVTFCLCDEGEIMFLSSFGSRMTL